MRRLHRTALLAALCLAGLAGGQEFLGPAVTLEGELTLAEAARAFGRQVGCTVQVPHLDKERAQRRVALALRGASPTAARAELERAYGITLRRWWRGGYGIEPQPAPVTPALGQPLAGLPGWTCWLSNVRASLSATLRSLAPDGLRTELQVVPRILIQTPSDAEGLRIVACSPPRSEPTLDVGPKAEGREPLLRWNQNSQDPSAWLLEQPMPRFAAGANRLERLCFDLYLMPLAAHGFSFEDLDQATAQTQSDAEVDVTVKPGGDPATLTIAMSGPLPEVGREAFLAAMYREGMVESRLVTADGQVLPAGMNAVNRDNKRDTWSTTCSLRRPERGDQAKAARLEMTLYLPCGEPEMRTIEFRNVPLPPLP